MKVIIFFVVFFAVMVLIPDSLVGSLVEHHIHISGDGEEAMDSFEFTVIAAKAAVSTVAAVIALWLYRKRKV